ncbi:EPIDERMAL PATTERNING FACTOR-like protein [Musa troglodytarum]|uniref:Epidermal patterning factor-like protein n=1 Tax=Musa troglodytarum TaxID=320322 RepID=A0A9E7JUQ7_9LILI|nr:EPIDERMAL PATTERNING FACTOR-like protein [Musa troglodytarum]
MQMRKFTALLLRLLCPFLPSFRRWQNDRGKRRVFLLVKSSPSPVLVRSLKSHQEMGLLHCITTHGTFHLLLSVLLLSSSAPAKHSAEGRPSLRLLEVANVRPRLGETYCLMRTSPLTYAFHTRLQGRGEERAMARALIGSRPPICERRCVTCGHCEAVQVPVIPQEESRSRQFLGVASLRGDFSSNYKPLSWKCKCGDVIFNP